MKFRVCVRRETLASKDFFVDAENAACAESRALDLAADTDWTGCGEAEYDIVETMVHRL